jgi:hypothetical protein
MSCGVLSAHYKLFTFLSVDIAISLEMPVPSQGHYGFHSVAVVD